MVYKLKKVVVLNQDRIPFQNHILKIIVMKQIL